MSPSGVPTKSTARWASGLRLYLVVFLAGPNPALPAESPYSDAHYQHVCERYGDPEQLAKYDCYFVDSITVLARLALIWAKTQPQAISERTGRQQHQRRAQALAPRSDDVARHFADQGHVGAQPLDDGGVDFAQFLRGQGGGLAAGF